MEAEIFDDDEDIGDKIEDFIPKYLFREQYRKCIRVFNELYQWTEDTFYHDMGAFHELALYHLIEHMSCLQREMTEFNEFFFDKKSKKLIEEAIQQDMEEFDEISLEECREIYYDISSYSDVLFIDTDFLFIDDIYNNRKLGNTILEENMGINIDYYFEILPMDLQEQYKTKHITLTAEVNSMLQYIQECIQYGNLYKLFWVNDKPVKENIIQLILENIMDAYFYNQEIEITREALLGNGEVDFKLYKNNHEDEKVLIEIKKQIVPI